VPAWHRCWNQWSVPCSTRMWGRRAAASVTAMDLAMHAGFLSHNDPDASLAFWRDALGFEIRNQRVTSPVRRRMTRSSEWHP
jgi:hypothetical protein